MYKVDVFSEYITKILGFLCSLKYDQISIMDVSDKYHKQLYASIHKLILPRCSNHLQLQAANGRVS